MTAGVHEGKGSRWSAGQDLLITDLRWSNLRGPRSLFRRYQDSFLEMFGPELTGRVVELGGEKHYGHARFFPNASEFVVSNVARDFDERLDITQMHYPDNSQDGYVCISVLQHVPEARVALAEIYRTLKPGGKLLMANGFGFPLCDVEDYWRMARSFYDRFFEEYDIKAVVRMGGIVSTVVEALMRPRGKWDRRYATYKSMAFVLATALRPFERLDGFPLGYGIYAEKRR